MPHKKKPGRPLSHKERGRRGGTVTLKRHGREHYKKIGSTTKRAK